MSASKSLVVLETPTLRPVGRRHSGIWARLALAAALAALLGSGTTLVLFFARPGGSHGLPAVSVAPVVFAEPWSESPLPIHVTPAADIRRGFVQIDGLPGLAMLSEGHATRPGSWIVPVSKLATLKITSPATEDAKPRLTIALVSHDGLVLSEVRPLLAVMPAWRVGGLPSPPPEPAAQRCHIKTPQPAAAPPSSWMWPGAREEAKSLVRRGDDAMSRGSIAAARQTYEYAAEEMGWPTGALALAATYDPHELAYLAPLVVPDIERARLWYLRAHALASARTDFYAQRLGLPPAAGGAVQAAQPTAAEPAPLWVWFGAMEAKSIMRWGDEAMSRGLIEAARQIYEYAAVVLRWPTAALALAATYDPHELVHRAPSVTAEPEKARLWYEHARELMDARIDFHLQRLGAPRASSKGTPQARTPVTRTPVASCG
jgi:hypothetical protein